MDRVELLPLVVGENRPQVFDFTNDVQVGESISSSTVVASVASGVDPSPTALMQGSATIAGLKVTRNAKPTLAGVIYNLLATAVTNLSNTYCKVGLLAIVPVDNIATDAPAPGMTTRIATFDTGLKSIAVSPTPLLTAPININGGQYQVNVYLTVSTTGSAGVVEVTVLWVDRLTGLNITKLISLSVLTISASETTFPIDAQANTQVLIAVGGSGFLGTTFVYQAECVVTRL